MDKEEIEEEQIKAFRDDQDRKQYNDYKVGTRKTPLTNNILVMLGDMLQPQTEGFNQVNMDMSFTYQDSFDVQFAKNSSFLITFCKLYGLKKSEYIERSNLATHLNISRSKNGKSMELFTTTVTKAQQEYLDKTEKKRGWFNLGKKKGEGS